MNSKGCQGLQAYLEDIDIENIFKSFDQNGDGVLTDG